MRIEPSSTSTFRGQVDEKKLAKEIKKEQPKKKKNGDFSFNKVFSDMEDTSDLHQIVSVEKWG